jgi:hypothetical protein
MEVDIKLKHLQSRWVCMHNAAYKFNYLFITSKQQYVITKIAVPIFRVILFQCFIRKPDIIDRTNKFPNGPNWASSVEELLAKGSINLTI